MPLRRVYFYLAIAVAVVLLGLGLRVFTDEFGSSEPTVAVIDKGSRPTGEGAPKPAIGGPFSLVDQTGKPVTNGDFRGRYMLVYFGYTYCPDVCPTTLSTISDALDLLGDKAGKVAALFITVDPAHDTPDQLAEYLKHFSPAIVGLTGTSGQVEAAAEAYGVEAAAMAPENDDHKDDYSVGHTATLYLMGPDGAYIRSFKYGVAAEAMALDILDAMGAAKAPAKALDNG